ncbi:MAG: adenosylcobinamide-GDP ribazoletransferase [Chloroflexota bacterium]
MGFLAALQFLTTIPVKRGFTAEQIGRSTGYFPLVGIIIGLILAGLNYALGLILPFSVVNALLIVAIVVLSGALHLDGLVDTCDGIAGHRTPEERWQVMHDSHAGGFGVIGAALLLLVKFVSLNNVPPSVMLFTLVAAPVTSRWSMVYAIFAYPYARPAGLGKSFKEATGWKQFTIATLITLAITIVLFKFGGLVILFGAWLLVILLVFYLKRKFAGLTGDTYGAINEIVETGVFIIIGLLAYNHWLL